MPSIAAPGPEIVRLAVEATLTESLKSSPTLTASTYAFVAASCAPVGSTTPVILEVLALITPEPVGESAISPLVELIVFPLMFRLSTVTAVNAPVLGVDAPIDELLIGLSI